MIKPIHSPLFYIYWFALICTAHVHATPVITNAKTGHTRIGDVFTFIAKALWVAHKYQVPYVHRECAYTHETYLCHCESFTEHCNKPVSYLAHNKDFKPDENIVYEIAYDYDDDTWDPIYQNDEWQHFKKMKNSFTHNSQFMKTLRALLQPKKQYKPQIPHNVISVAIHIRTGGDFKFDEFNKTIFTLRFMPLQYYAWALKQVCNTYPGQWLYVHLFTDDSHPEQLVEQLQTELANYPLRMSYRTTGNRYDANVLEDLWAMSYYTCLIRPWSQYSFYSELFGNHSLVIFPETCTENGYIIGVKNGDDVRYEMFS